MTIAKARYDISVESLSSRCTLCDKLIHPSQVMRLDFNRERCPHCGGEFESVTKRGQSIAIQGDNR